MNTTRYWFRIGDRILGPLPVDELVRRPAVRFATLVCSEDRDRGDRRNWSALRSVLALRVALKVRRTDQPSCPDRPPPSDPPWLRDEPLAERAESTDAAQPVDAERVAAAAPIRLSGELVGRAWHGPRVIERLAEGFESLSRPAKLAALAGAAFVAAGSALVGLVAAYEAWRG